MNGYSYPNIDKEKSLPFYVVGIGVNQWQYHVIRSKGYKHPQILYCTKGEGELIINDKIYNILPFTSFYIPALVPHEYYSLGNIWDTHWITFDGFAVNDTLKSFNLTNANVFHLKDHKNLDIHFKRLYNMSKSNKDYNGFYMSGLLYEFLIEYNRTLNHKAVIYSITSNEVLKSVINYIDMHYREQITLKDLCKVHNVSPQHLCRLFQKYLNMRPIEYINHTRIEEAKILLHTSDLNISEIAKKSGFQNPNYFSLLFKRHENMTPGEYRRIK